MAVAEDVREILRRMPEAFVPEKAAGLDALIQLNLTGEGGGEWQIKVANGQMISRRRISGHLAALLNQFNKYGLPGR